jgi:hypothetical protein
MIEHRYSLKKIISHDFIALAAFICVVIGMVFSLEVYFIGYMFSRRTFSFELLPFEERFLYVYVFCGIALIGFLCFIIRLNIIKSFFNFGIEVKGIILELSYWRDRGKILYRYNIEGQEYRKQAAIHITKTTSNLGKDDEVSVLVKPENHSKAIILDLFAEDN